MFDFMTNRNEIHPTGTTHYWWKSDMNASRETKGLFMITLGA
jgi:hypothetical protein